MQMRMCVCGTGMKDLRDLTSFNYALELVSIYVQHFQLISFDTFIFMQFRFGTH